MDKTDIELLEGCKANHEWWKSGDTVISVAYILEDEGCFGYGDEKAVKNCIYYFEKPWKYEDDISQILEEEYWYRIEEDLKKCLDIPYAIDWLVAFDIQDIIGQSNLEHLAYKYTGVLL